MDIALYFLLKVLKFSFSQIVPPPGMFVCLGCPVRLSCYFWVWVTMIPAPSTELIIHSLWICHATSGSGCKSSLHTHMDHVSGLPFTFFFWVTCSPPPPHHLTVRFNLSPSWDSLTMNLNGCLILRRPSFCSSFLVLVLLCCKWRWGEYPSRNLYRHACWFKINSLNEITKEAHF